MTEIIGYNKFHSKKTDKDYVTVYYTYADKIDFGLKCGSCICTPEYFDKLKSADILAVGYDREKQQNFLYIK